MKMYILQQDDCMIRPSMILGNLKRNSEIAQPLRGFPALEQVANCVKYLRVRMGSENVYAAVRKLVSRLTVHEYGQGLQDLIDGM